MTHATGPASPPLSVTARRVLHRAWGCCAQVKKVAKGVEILVARVWHVLEKHLVAHASKNLALLAYNETAGFMRPTKQLYARFERLATRLYESMVAAAKLEHELALEAKDIDEEGPEPATATTDATPDFSALAAKYSGGGEDAFSEMLKEMSKKQVYTRTKPEALADTTC